MIARALPKLADVVVIGGGIVGTSIAREIALTSAGSVALLERRTIAAGASGWTGALLRQHYSNEPEARLASWSLDVFRNWNDRIGGACGHDPCGLVVTVPNGPGCEANVERLRANIAMQNRLGIDSRAITGEELVTLEPSAVADDIRLASFEPTSGYVDSVAATRSMAAAALTAGASLVDGAGPVRLVVERDRVVGVSSELGTTFAETVIVAAGPWSTALLAPAGVTLPVSAIRVQVAVVHRPWEMETPHFVYIDMAAGMFCRPWGPGRTLVGVAGGEQHDSVNPDAFETRNDPGYPPLAIATAARRMPAMSRANYLHGHAGLYDMSPDAHPIIGATGCEGLYVAAGFSGAGFKKGPAVGKAMSELVVGGRSTTFDIQPFRLSRFETDAWRQPWSPNEYVFDADFGHGL